MAVSGTWCSASPQLSPSPCRPSPPGEKDDHDHDDDDRNDDDDDDYDHDDDDGHQYYDTTLFLLSLGNDSKKCGFSLSFPWRLPTGRNSPGGLKRRQKSVVLTQYSVSIKGTEAY